MNNVRDLGVAIELDKTRHMKFSLNALCDLQDEYGDVIDVFTQATEQQDFKKIRKLLWASLRDEDETLEERHVGKMIDMRNLNPIIEKLVEAITESVPDSEGKSETKPREAKKK